MKKVMRVHSNEVTHYTTRGGESKQAITIVVVKNSKKYKATLFGAATISGVVFQQHLLPPESGTYSTKLCVGQMISA